MTYTLLPAPQTIDALGGWAPQLPGFTHVTGHSGLGHFFLWNERTGEHAVLHPYRQAHKSYGAFDSVAAFELAVLADDGFAAFVLLPDHQAAIAAHLGPLGPEEVYIACPYPFLGGDESSETYMKGNVWVFADLVGQAHGFESPTASEPEAAAPGGRKRSWWRGLLGGVVAKFLASTLLVVLAGAVGQGFAASSGEPPAWLAGMESARSDGWLLLQAINLLSAAAGGWVAAWWSPRRSWWAPGLVVLLFALAALFARLPETRSVLWLGVWALGAPVGAAFGAGIQRWREARA